LETVFTFKVNVTLTFDLKIKKGHVLVMNNHHTKFEVPRPKLSLVITGNHLVYGTTDRQMQSNIPPLL
jgi:hypothetical protein